MNITSVQRLPDIFQTYIDGDLDKRNDSKLSYKNEIDIPSRTNSNYFLPNAISAHRKSHSSSLNSARHFHQTQYHNENNITHETVLDSVLNLQASKAFLYPKRSRMEQDMEMFNTKYSSIFSQTAKNSGFDGTMKRRRSIELPEDFDLNMGDA